MAESNSYGVPVTIGSTTTTGGFFAALDATTGSVLWRTADPAGAGDWGAVSTANGVVYGCGGDSQGHMYALDAASGAILWSFASGQTCYGGPAISHGQVFWGTGYAQALGGPNEPSHLFAFSVP